MFIRATEFGFNLQTHQCMCVYFDLLTTRSKRSLDLPSLWIEK